MFWIEGLTFLKLLHIIVGVLFTMFIPGFLLTLLLFRRMDLLERFALGFGLSISITIFFGLIFTFPNDNRISAVVGGINGVLPALIFVSAGMMVGVYGAKFYKKWSDEKPPKAIKK